MPKKNTFIDCPGCGKRISLYALLCPHCGVRISQEDFGKIDGRAGPSVVFDSPSDHKTGHGWTNVVMLALIVVSVLGIFSRYQEKFLKQPGKGSAFQVSISRRDFEKICREGLARTKFQENEDARKMLQVLDSYAELHGYPNRAALLKTCARAADVYSGEESESTGGAE